MNDTDNIRPTLTGHHAPVEAGPDLVEVTGAGLRIAELFVVGVAGLLIWPPLLTIAVVVAIPAIAIAAVVAALVGIVAVPVWLVRDVLAHHRAHRSTLFLHRLVP